MRIAAKYSFNDGEKVIKRKYPRLLEEIEAIIAAVDSSKYKTKRSKERTKKFRILFNPGGLNAAFKVEFSKRGWKPKKIKCEYSTKHYVEGYEPSKVKHSTPSREMDFVKDKLGVEVQFGKYAFMVYNVCAKMTIFKNLGCIDCGIEIVPMHGFSKEMSTGVSYFEQFAWDLDQRGVSDIDIPVLIIGVDVDVIIEPKQEVAIGSENGEILEATSLVS